MNDLDYYKALYEQLQAQLNLIEKRFDISKFNKSKKNKNGKKSTKDYDGDGEVESAKDEYFGSKDKAIKKAISDKKKKTTLKEGTVISYGQISYGGFPRILNEEAQEPRRSRGGIVYPSEEYAILHQASQEAGDAAAAANDAALKYHQEAAKDWRGSFRRQTPASKNITQHLKELSGRMDRDPTMQKLRADLAAAQTASSEAYQALIKHPDHPEFMKKAQAQSNSVYGTRGNLGS